MEKLLNVAAAAEHLGITKDTLRRKVRGGEIAAIYLNSRAIRIREKDLKRYLVSRSRRRQS